MTITPLHVCNIPYWNMMRTAFPLLMMWQVVPSKWNTTENDSVGNASLATLKVYEVNKDAIKFCIHWPKVIPKNKIPTTICRVSAISTLHSRWLLHNLLNSGSSCCLSSNHACPRESCSRTFLRQRLSKHCLVNSWHNTLSLCTASTFQSSIKTDPLLNKKHSSSTMTPVGMTWYLTQVSCVIQVSSLTMSLVKCKVRQCIAHVSSQGIQPEDFNNLEDMYHIQFKDKLLGHDLLELYTNEILDAHYQWTGIKDAHSISQPVKRLT